METTTINDIKTLIKIQTADDIQSVEIVDDFVDDGQQCAIAKINGATIVASDSTINFGVSIPNLPQVIFSFGTAPE